MGNYTRSGNVMRIKGKCTKLHLFTSDEQICFLYFKKWLKYLHLNSGFNFSCGRSSQTSLGNCRHVPDWKVLIVSDAIFPPSYLTQRQEAVINLLLKLTLSCCLSNSGEVTFGSEMKLTLISPPFFSGYKSSKLPWLKKKSTWRHWGSCASMVTGFFEGVGLVM